MKNTGRQYARNSSRSTLRCRLIIGLLCWYAVLAASAHAQLRSVSNFDDINTSGGPHSITDIQRFNSGAVTAHLDPNQGNLIVTGNGFVTVTISGADPNSFAGTFVVPNGANGPTVTWIQPGGFPATGLLNNVTGTVIATGWGLCLGGPLSGDPAHSCAGANAPGSTSQTFHNATPSLQGDGDGTMLLSESGLDSNPGSQKGSNTGWFYNAGPSTTATNFTLDLQFNIADNTNIQALEFDQFQVLKTGDGGVIADTNVFFGTQCVTGDDWQVWDQFKGVTNTGGGGWTHTGQPCRGSYVVSSTAFNHLTIKAHRVLGDTSCSFTTPVQFSGPAIYYDSITLNGTVVVANQKTCSGPPTGGNDEQTGLFIQLDTTSSCGSACTISEFIGEGSFLASDVSAWWPAVQSLLVH